MSRIEAEAREVLLRRRRSLAEGARPVPGGPAARWSDYEGASDALSGLDGFYVQVDTDAGYSSPDWEGLVDGTSSVLPALPEGSYNWHVKARDAAGNWGEYGPGSTFGIHTPVEPIPATHKEPFLSLANPLFLITLVAVLAVIGGSVAAAARRRKKEPPAEAPAASGAAPPVNWE